MSDANIRLKVSVQDDGSVVIKGIGKEFEGLGRKAKSGTDIAAAALSTLQGTILVAVASKFVQTFAQMATAAINYADALNDVATKVGVTTTELQEIRFAANEAGGGFEKTDKALQKLALNAAKAAKGEGELLEVAQKYNLVLTDSQGGLRSNIDIMGEVAEAIKGAKTQQEKLSIAAAAFGAKEGAGLVAILGQGAEGFDLARQKAHEYGAVLEEDVIKRAQVTSDKMDAAASIIKKELSEAFVSIAPVIEFAAAALAKFAAGISYVIENAPKVVSELAGNRPDYDKQYQDWMLEQYGYGPQQPAPPAAVAPALGPGEGTKKKEVDRKKEYDKIFRVAGEDASGPADAYAQYLQTLAQKRLDWEEFVGQASLDAAIRYASQREAASLVMEERIGQAALDAAIKAQSNRETTAAAMEERAGQDSLDAAIRREEQRSAFLAEIEERRGQASLDLAIRTVQAREEFEDRMAEQRWKNAVKTSTETRKIWDAANKSMAFSSENVNDIQIQGFKNVAAAAGRNLTDMVFHGKKWEDAMKGIWDSYMEYVSQKLIEMAAWKTLMFFFPGGGGLNDVLSQGLGFKGSMGGGSSPLGSSGENFIRTAETSAVLPKVSGIDATAMVAQSLARSSATNLDTSKALAAEAERSFSALLAHGRKGIEVFLEGYAAQRQSEITARRPDFTPMGTTPRTSSPLGSSGENFIRTLEMANRRPAAPIYVTVVSTLDGREVARSVARAAVAGDATDGRYSLALARS